jgi:hypothetical protein
MLILAPSASVASAQTAAPTTATSVCAIALGPLTKQQESLVNDYEILVNKANNAHTAVPPMPDNVAILIGCTSPASTTPAATGTTTSTSTSSTSTTASTPTSGQPSATFVCPNTGLTRAQRSMINDYEVLVAKANSAHTPVPPIPQDVANFISCE